MLAQLQEILFCYFPSKVIDSDLFWPKVTAQIHTNNRVKLVVQFSKNDLDYGPSINDVASRGERGGTPKGNERRQGGKDSILIRGDVIFQH